MVLFKGQAEKNAKKLSREIMVNVVEAKVSRRSLVEDTGFNL